MRRRRQLRPEPWAPAGRVGTGGGGSSAQPLGVSVTTPNGGTVTIVTSAAGATPPTGFQFLGQELEISAPPASASSPLTLTFTLDGSVLGLTPPASAQVFRDGTLVASCASATFPPDPCVSSRIATADGGVTIAVLSSHASAWTWASHRRRS